MRLRTIVSVILIALLIASPAMAEKVTWRATSAYQVTSNSGLAFDEMAAKLLELSGGTFELKTNPGGSLGFKNADNFEVVGDGLVEVAETSAGSLIGIDQLFGIVALPFIASSDEAVQNMMEATYEAFSKIFQSNNQKLIGWGSFPAVGVFAKKPVTNLEGFNGMKIRTYDAFSAEAFSAFGAAPVQLPWGEVVLSLSSGVIDAVLTSSEGGVLINIWDLGMTDYTRFGYSTPVTLLHVSGEAFESLSTGHQEAILKAGEYFTKRNWELAQERITSNLATLKKNGITLHDKMGPSVLKKNQEIASSAALEWVKKTGPKGQALLDQLKSK